MKSCILYTKLHSGIFEKGDLKKIADHGAKFVAVGFSSTIVYLLVYYIIIFINPEMYFLANSAGWLLGIVNTFFWQHKFVFPSSINQTKNTRRRFVRACIMFSFSYAMYTALLFLAVRILHIPPVFAPFLIMTITIPTNFAISYLWTYRDK